MGVLLYELLVGDLPFTRTSLRAAGFLEIQRMIREDDPQKPSTRISTGVDHVHGGRGPAHRPARARPPPPGRPRLDRHASHRQGSHAPLRDRERARRGHPAAPGERASARQPAEHALRARQVRPPLSLAGGGRRPRVPHRSRRRDRRRGLRDRGPRPGRRSTARAQRRAAAGGDRREKEAEAQRDKERLFGFAVAAWLEDAEKEQETMFPAWPFHLQALQGWLDQWDEPSASACPGSGTRSPRSRRTRYRGPPRNGRPIARAASGAASSSRTRRTGSCTRRCGASTRTSGRSSPRTGCARTSGDVWRGRAGFKHSPCATRAPG